MSPRAEHDPFSDDPRETVASCDEAGLLRLIRESLGEANPPCPEGMGDDCAVVPWMPGPMLVTVDSVVYGRHFDATLPPALAGAKLVRRNLSDIAAMGGHPMACVVQMLMPACTRLDWLRAFFEGVGLEAKAHGFKVNGGDLASTERDLAASLTLLGGAPRPVPRHGSRPGDRLYVTGPLGGSLLRKHWDFVPRLIEGQWLAGRSEVRAMMDISDGLACDLPRMLAAGTHARIDAGAVASDAARALSLRSGGTPAGHALADGEDCELLFAIDGAASIEVFEAAYVHALGVPPLRLGQVLDGPGPDGCPLADMAGRPLRARAYDHFNKGDATR